MHLLHNIDRGPNKEAMIKGIVHPKLNVLSSFIHPHSKPVYDSFGGTQKMIFQKCL